MGKVKFANRDRHGCCRRVIDMLRFGGKIPEVAQEIGCSEDVLRRWMKEADRSERDASLRLGARERAELVRLRLENGRLKTERDVLLKTSARGSEAISPPVRLAASSVQDNKSAAPTADDDITVWVHGLT